MRPNPIAAVLASTLPLALFLAGCGGGCPEAMSAKNGTDTYNADVTRINRFVIQRKKAKDFMEAKQGDVFKMERARFSITALEMAIDSQTQIMLLSWEHKDNADVDKQRARLAEARCELEELASQEDFEISDNQGRDLLKLRNDIRERFGKLGQPSKRQLERVYGSGLEPIKAEGAAEAAGDESEKKDSDKSESDRSSDSKESGDSQDSESDF